MQESKGKTENDIKLLYLKKGHWKYNYLVYQNSIQWKKFYQWMISGDETGDGKSRYIGELKAIEIWVYVLNLNQHKKGYTVKKWDKFHNCLDRERLP